MNDFTRQYLVAALWSTTDESREDGGDPLDDNYGVDDIEPDAIAAAELDCDRFRELAGDLLDERSNTSQGAHDFWLTRNGHGAGFWDGDWSEPHATKLDDGAKDYGEIIIYQGDDGLIHGG